MKTNPLSTIKKRQTLFRSLSGITVEKFDELVKEITPQYQRAEEKKRSHTIFTPRPIFIFYFKFIKVIIFSFTNSEALIAASASSFVTSSSSPG